MKIILTGAAGFIGSCFLWQLNSMGIDDVILVDTPSHPDGIANLKDKKFKAYVAREELLDRLVKGQLKDVDLIVHLGACADTTEMDTTFLSRNNVEYSKSLAKWALANNKFFHYASSAAIYGNGKAGYGDDDSLIDKYKPLNPYGESKWQFDKWLIQGGITKKVVGYRYFNVFGPNEYHKGEMKSMVCKAHHQIKENGSAKLFATSRKGFEDGSEERDFVYVKDINRVMAFFVEHPDRSGIFNLGTGKARSFKSLAESVFSAMGRTLNIEYIPMPDKLKGQYQYFTQADISKLRQAGYGEEFLTLEKSVSDYVKNYLTKNDPIL